MSEFSNSLAREIVEETPDVTMDLREETTRNFDSLQQELMKEEPDVGRVQRLWKWLKRNADWVVPTLTEVVIEGLRRAVG